MNKVIEKLPKIDATNAKVERRNNLRQDLERQSNGSFTKDVNTFPRI